MNGDAAGTRIDLVNEVVWDKDGGEGGCLMSALTGIAVVAGPIAVAVAAQDVIIPAIVGMWAK